MNFSIINRGAFNQSFALVAIITLLVTSFGFTNFAQATVSECHIGENLIQNGSFENPVVGGVGWNVYDSVIGGLVWIVDWINPNTDNLDIPFNPAVAKLELQNIFAYQGPDAPLGYTPAAGEQYAELDSDLDGPSGAEYNGERTSVAISQILSTIPGATYEFSFKFSPLPHLNTAENAVKVTIGGIDQGTISANGVANSNTVWVKHAYSIVATSTQTTVKLQDAGITGSLGTLVDDVQFTCTGENDDDNEGGGGDDGKNTLTITTSGDGEGIVISGDEGTAINCDSNATSTCQATFDENEVVTLNVNPDEGSNFENSWTVGFGTCTGNTSPCTVTMSADVDLTAHFDLNTTDINGGGSSGGGGGSSSSKKKTGSVLGDSTSNDPEGKVLGAATSTLPVGAPNTGAGGTSPVAPVLPSLFAILSQTRTKVAKNG